MKLLLLAFDIFCVAFIATAGFMAISYLGLPLILTQVLCGTLGGVALAAFGWVIVK